MLPLWLFWVELQNGSASRLHLSQAPQDFPTTGIYSWGLSLWLCDSVNYGKWLVHTISHKSDFDFSTLGFLKMQLNKKMEFVNFNLPTLTLKSTFILKYPFLKNVPLIFLDGLSVFLSSKFPTHCWSISKSVHYLDYNTVFFSSDAEWNTWVHLPVGNPANIVSHLQNKMSVSSKLLNSSVLSFSFRF